MASFTSSVAWVQISISSWRRSSSVMMPRRYWLLDLLGALLVPSRIFAFSGGVVTSSMPIVTPARVA